MIVRPASANDRAALRAAIVLLQEHERALHDTRLPGEDCADACLAALDDCGVFVAEEDGGVVGFVGCRIVQEANAGETADSNRYGLVNDLCVLPPSRGRGIAGVLLAAAEAHLASERITRLRITTLANNRLADRAYGKRGFAPYEVTFEKRLIRTD